MSISENPCHFWSHSFLGIGTASLALQQICNFIEGTLGAARIPDRFSELRTINTSVPDLLELRINDPFWTEDHLSQIKLPKTISDKPLVPVLAYFSARDGFKSTFTTISAPLSCVSCCNTNQWSLLTLTHEISHIIARGVLSELYPDLDSDAEVKAALCLVGSVGPAGNLLDEIRRFLFCSIIKMDDVADNREEPPEYDEEMFRKLLEHWHHSVEENIAHIFDFMYFYGQDVTKYITGIWTSWGTIPNINSRITDYVVRTICAVLPPQVRKGENGLEIVKEQVRECLSSLRDKHQPNTYTTKALNYLTSHWDDEIRNKVYARIPIVKIVRSFLFSKNIATIVRSETEISGGASDREGYTLREGLLESRKIRNPIRFLELYSRSHDASPQLSAWLLYTLAFCVDQDEK